MLPHLGIGTQGNVGVLLVDDHSAVRQGLRMLFQMEPAAAVIGEAGTGAEALALAGNLKPDVVIMDVEMPGMDGIEATALLVAMLPQVAVIVLHDARQLRRAPHAPLLPAPRPSSKSASLRKY